MWVSLSFIDSNNNLTGGCWNWLFNGRGRWSPFRQMWRSMVRKWAEKCRAGRAEWWSRWQVQFRHWRRVLSLLAHHATGPAWVWLLVREPPVHVNGNRDYKFLLRRMMMRTSARVVMLLVMLMTERMVVGMWTCSVHPRRPTSDQSRFDSFPFCAPVLEPDLDLHFGQSQLMSDLGALCQTQIFFRLKFSFQFN